MALRSTSPFRFARRALCAGVAASFGLTGFAQTSGLAAIHGSATLSREGSVTTVTTVNGAGGRSVLNWSSFGVGQGETMRFQQPDAASTSINRVLGGSPSAIAGTLSSNGRLVLVNPAGIAVGAGAVVDTAGFTASTLGISRDNAIAGRLLFGSGDLGDFARQDGTLQVQGNAQVLARSGDVVLVGRNIQVDSPALLQASGGDVVLAAGRTVEVTGPGLEGILMQVRAPDDQAINLGTLRGDSVAIFAGQLQHSGLIRAQSVSTVGGKVVLQATDKAEVSGRIEASNAARGGTVLATGDQLTLKSTAVIDASHAAGGGEILVGGGQNGQDARLPNARLVVVEQGVLLRADATLAGNGGSVFAWSDGDMDFRGTAQARGAGGGAPGIVQVGALGRLRNEGLIDVNGDGASGGTTTSGSGSGSSGSGSGSSGSDGGSSGSGSGDSGSSGGSGTSGGSGDSGTSGGSGDSGSSGESASSGSSDDSGKSGGSGSSGGSASSGGSRTSGSSGDFSGSGSTEVRSATERTASVTTNYLTKGPKLLEPGRDDQISLLQPARAASDADSDARVLGAGPEDRKDKRRERDIVVTGAQCRPGP